MDDFRKNAFTEALAVAKELPLIRLTIRFYHLCVSLLLVRGAYGRVITTSDGREVASTIVEYRVYCVREVFLGRGQAALLLELAGFFPARGSSLPPLCQHQLILLLILYLQDFLVGRQIVVVTWLLEGGVRYCGDDPLRLVTVHAVLRRWPSIILPRTD